jgi:hypothetical protein
LSLVFERNCSKSKNILTVVFFVFELQTSTTRIRSLNAILDALTFCLSIYRKHFGNFVFMKSQIFDLRHKKSTQQWRNCFISKSNTAAGVWILLKTRVTFLILVSLLVLFVFYILSYFRKHLTYFVIKKEKLNTNKQHTFIYEWYILKRFFYYTFFTYLQMRPSV